MRVFAPILLFGLLATACGDPTGSSTDPTVLPLGREVSGNVGPGDTAWYEHRAAGAGEAFSVVLRAFDGSVTAVVQDAAGREVVPPITATYNPPLVGRSATPEIVPAGPTGYRLIVTGDGNFRIQIAPSESAPEHAPAEIVAGTTISESIDGPSDADEFFLHGNPGDIIIAYLQALNPADTRELNLAVSGPGFFGTVTAASTSRDSELETQPTERFVLESAEPYRFRLTGPYVGAFRFKVRKIDARPETVPQAAAENTPVSTERLDYVGDIDDFVIRGPAGTEYNVMVRLANGDPASTVRAEVSSAEIDPYFFNVTSSGRDSLLADRATGRFALGASGTATVRIQSVGLARGPYELLVYRIDPAPEGPKRALTPSDSVLTETIEFPGDVDEYTLDLATDDTLTVIVAPDPGSPWATPAFVALQARILTPLGEVVAQTFSGPEVGGATGPKPLAAGHYRVQVMSLLDKVDGYRGPYRLAAYRLRSGPETGSAAIAFGAVVTDAVDPAGDVDTYEITATKGDHIDIRFQLLEPSGYGGLTTLFSRGRDNWLLVATPSGLLPVPDLDQVGSGRITIDETGRFLVAVVSQNGGGLASERGRYRMMVRRYPSVPEHHAQRLVAGDVVADEATDELGDVDEFWLEGPSGTEVAVYLTSGPGPGGIRVELVDAVTKDVIRSIDSFGGFQSLGRVVLPASGRWLLRVAEPRWPEPLTLTPFTRTGGYRLEIQPINRAPEQHAAAIAIGDTVSGESIVPVGDIDEFTFSGVAGQRLAGLFDTPLGLSPPGLALEVIGPGGAVLASVSNYNPTPTFGDARTPAFTLPATGTYLIRVRALDEFATRGGPYRFAVSAAPP